MNWTNYYLCSCGHAWQDTHECCCNDKCPKCNKEVEPYISDDGSVAQGDIDAARTSAAAKLTTSIDCRVRAISYEYAAREYAARIHADHYYNCSSDVQLWQIGSKQYRLTPDGGALDIASTPGLPAVALPVWFTVTLTS